MASPFLYFCSSGPVNSTKCSKKHANRFRECIEGVVYKIELSCGKSYVGQTGRCINDRLREHANTIRTGTGSNLAAHCAKYQQCQLSPPAYDSTVILKRYREQCTREIHEAFVIHTVGDRCVSTPSIELYDREIKYLGS